MTTNAHHSDGSRCLQAETTGDCPKSHRWIAGEEYNVDHLDRLLIDAAEAWTEESATDPDAQHRLTRCRERVATKLSAVLDLPSVRVVTPSAWVTVRDTAHAWVVAERHRMALAAQLESDAAEYSRLVGTMADVEAAIR